MASTDINDTHSAAMELKPRSFGFVAFCAGFAVAFLVATVAWFGALWWIVSRIWSWF